MMDYLEFDGGDYTGLRKRLLETGRSEFQREFLEATKDSESFIQWIEQEQNISLEKEGKEFDLWADQLSEAEYKTPPKNLEKKLFDMWNGLTPAQASRETFWGYITLGHIKQGIIESSYLAANDNDSLSGLRRIDQALSPGQERWIYPVVLTILRHLSGLPEKRGGRSVYVNCSFARAWWRGYVAREVCKATGADFDKIFATLRGSSQGTWEELIDLIVSQNSILGDTKVRSALIWALSERDEIKPAKTLRKISNQIGIRSALRELGVFEVGELKEQIIKPIISRVLENEQKTKDKAEVERNEKQKSNAFKRILRRR